MKIETEAEANNSQNDSGNSSNFGTISKQQEKADNRLYGLHALNNLDIAVNGKEVNSMPSYQEVRRNSQQINPSSTSSFSDSNSSPSATLNNSNNSKNNLVTSTASITPSKPPRTKAPSTSPPPTSRRGRHIAGMTHYAQPAISGLSSSDMMDQLSQDLRFKRRMIASEATTTAEDSAIASGGDADDSTVTSSYTSRFIRKSPPRQLQPPPSAASSKK